MGNLRLLFFVGLAAGFISEKLLVSSIADDLYLEGQASGDFPIDDDDREDQGSGSGSGDYDDMLRRISNFSRTTVSKEMIPSQPQPTADSQDPSTTVKDTETTPFRFPGGDKEDEESTGYLSTSMPPSETTATKFGKDITVSKDADEGNGLDSWDVSVTKGGRDEGQIKEVENEILAKDGRGSRMYDMESPKEVTSENLWERTEVLAAVIACGVVGFLCAVFLLLLVVYRMKKKDEGSYELGDTKLSSTIYHKAPTKEFYA